MPISKPKKRFYYFQTSNVTFHCILETKIQHVRYFLIIYLNLISSFCERINFRATLKPIPSDFNYSCYSAIKIFSSHIKFENM